MMYGKHFTTMYDGSMVGKGFAVFAVMGYVIANQKPDRLGVFQLRLQPTVLSAVFGEQPEKIEAAIKFLCSPDPRSTTPAEGGRRLVQITNFDYRVVNGAHYARMINEEKRREQLRASQAGRRQKLKAEKKPKRGGGSLNERLACAGKLPMPNDPTADYSDPESPL